MADRTNIFQFMVIRAPEASPEHPSRGSYIHDDQISLNGRVSADLFGPTSASKIGRLIHQLVFCSDDFDGFRPDFDFTFDLLLRSLKTYTPICGGEIGVPDGPDESTVVKLEELVNRHYFSSPVYGPVYYLLPDRISDLSSPHPTILKSLLDLRQLLDAAAATDAATKLDLPVLREDLGAVLGATPLIDQVLNEKRTGTGSAFLNTKRVLFDALYLLYILRRRISVNLEEIISGLQVLHTLEALAIDEVLYGLQAMGPQTALEERLRRTLAGVVPALRNWKSGTLPAGVPLIADAHALAKRLAATPVIHPLFAQLHRFRTPFNPIRPLGIGDLKVVKQWLCEYRVGEIAHIDNVLQGESRSRVHRRLEKSEDTFSFSSDRTTETHEETQSTERFELKREADTVIKTDVNANVASSVNFSYGGGGYSIVTALNGGFAYARSQNDQNKLSMNFARDVVEKAISRVQGKVTEQRSSTRLFETEETTSHSVDNKAGQGHISGLYHWLDKAYHAQVFNYGKRLMFEFMIPEPAAFLVESRMRGFEAALDVPQPPVEPRLKTVSLSFTADDIKDAKFLELRDAYELGDELASMPPEQKTVDFLTEGSGEGLFFEKDIDKWVGWHQKSHTCKLAVTGYELTQLIVFGRVEWHNTSETISGAIQANAVKIGINGKEVVGAFAFPPTPTFDVVRELQKAWTFAATPFLPAPTDRVVFHDDTVTLNLGFFDAWKYSLSMRGVLKLTDQGRRDFQSKVFKTILRQEQKVVDAANKELELAYKTQLATYRNRIEQLRAQAINDLLKGATEAGNRRVIQRELKRSCLAMLTKDLDASRREDSFTDVDAIGRRPVEAYEYHRFSVTENPATTTAVAKTTVAFDLVYEDINYAAPDVEKAGTKGRYVQFLEQAFEWQHLTYICYPYFWAIPPRWVQLMNRGDDLDPNLTSFLQAGYAKLVIAVSPGYDEAVLHYLATGEPWEGGPAPVIGDPLYLPLHEEMHKQQDDLDGATPEGKPWPFTLPTSLVYLENSSTPLPPSGCKPPHP